MKFGGKILLSCLLIFSLGLYYLTYDVLDKVRYRYLEGVEDSLVDQARILSSFISHSIENETFSPETLSIIFKNAYQTKFSAQIYKLNKTNVDVRVYITDKNGIILFDSTGKEEIGTNYSKWRDVAFTLKGEYGARSTREDPDDSLTSILYVASPVIIKGEIAGVLTVAKPVTNINRFLKFAKLQIKNRSLLAGFFVLIFSILAIWLITRPIRRLMRYADNISEGKKVDLPRLDRTEISKLGNALDRMRNALEGKKYVENYVQTLTHEIKSPVSAIRGAAELLEEEMPPLQRNLFINNIKNEAKRIRYLVDRMLALASLENMNTLEKKEQVNLQTLLDDVLESMMPIISARSLEIKQQCGNGTVVYGDPFLLRQVISNLVQNAIDFSPSGAAIEVSVIDKPDYIHFQVKDQGTGIPEFAHDKIYNRFFSMQRPEDGKKSTGLGLNFVKEIAELHCGFVTLENRRKENGVIATFSVPRKIKKK